MSLRIDITTTNLPFLGLVAYDDDSLSEAEDAHHLSISNNTPSEPDPVDVRVFIAELDGLRFPPARYIFSALARIHHLSFALTLHQAVRIYVSFARVFSIVTSPNAHLVVKHSFGCNQVANHHSPAHSQQASSSRSP